MAGRSRRVEIKEELKMQFFVVDFFLNKMDTWQNMKCRIDLMAHKCPKSHAFGALKSLKRDPQKRYNLNQK